MKTNILIAVAIGLITYGLTIYFNHNTAPNIIVQDEQAASKPLETGSIAPNFSFKTTKNTQHTLSDFKGKIVILNFWASWCAPCIKEFPDLLELAENYGDAAVLIAISSDHDESQMLKFLDKMQKSDVPIQKKNVLIARDEDNRITREIFQTYRLPETIIIDSNGIMRHKLIGANWTLKDATEILSKLSE